MNSIDNVAQRAAHHPPVQTYLFIDGEYLRREFEECMTAIYGTHGTLDFRRLKELMNAVKAFYFDAIAEPNELPPIATAEEIERFNKQSEQRDSKARLFSEIQRMNGYHVITGTGRRRERHGKGIEQKEVDVALAVKALVHAARGNTSHIAIIAGDLDFRPLVDGLIELGTYVTLHSCKKSTSDDMLLAPDSHYELNPDLFYELSDDEWKKANVEIENVSMTMHFSSWVPLEQAEDATGKAWVIYDVGSNVEREFRGRFYAKNPRYLVQPGHCCSNIDVLKRLLAYRYDVRSWVKPTQN